MAKFNIDTVEAMTMHGLKDFQRKTVERIDYLFRNGQNRVLIADEVGMGKTLIARGAIVKTARVRLEEGDDLLKVVYICSNTSIANQNIYLLNTKKERVELPNNTSIQISASSRSDFIIGLSYSGETFVIDTTYEDSLLKFKSSERSHYYLRCRKNVDTDVDVDSPQTGDTSNIHLWIMLLLVSLVMLIITSKKYLAYRER